MVDRVDKALDKLPPKQQKIYVELIQKILSGKIDQLDVVKLKNTDNVYRVRKGVYRIIFQKMKEGKVNIIAFEHRSDRTYHDF